MSHHVSVVLKETIDELDIKGDGIYIDCTLGGAGHALYLLGQLNDDNRLVAIDQDTTALESVKEVLGDHLHKVMFVHNNFRELTDILRNLGIEKVDGIYYDLGVSSLQLDIPGGGFNYHHDVKLDMHMDQTQGLTAHDVVNDQPHEALVKIFHRYGEEKFSRQIARRIEAHRKQQPIETTLEPVDIIKEGIPAKARRKDGHPVKHIFQAVRIAMNDGLSALEDLIEQATEHVKIKDRISVITFHSLENRLCKQIFQEYEKGPGVPRELLIILETYTPRLKRVNRKPITAIEENLDENNRAHSAKLRVAEILK